MLSPRANIRLSFLVVAAAANNDYNCKDNEPGAVVIKDVA
jgi:hypothetical protein